jgi:hypothetical protein
LRRQSQSSISWLDPSQAIATLCFRMKLRVFGCHYITNEARADSGKSARSLHKNMALPDKQHHWAGFDQGITGVLFRSE